MGACPVPPAMSTGGKTVRRHREYYCPKCGTLLEVEYVTPGYPVVMDFLPDIEGFYTQWLGRPVPQG